MFNASMRKSRTTVFADPVVWKYIEDLDSPLMLAVNCREGAESACSFQSMDSRVATPPVLLSPWITCSITAVVCLG